jgi:splicing factor 3B subunit 2
MTIHGDVYYENKENETTMKDRKPGDLTNDLKEALGIPTVCLALMRLL